MENSDTGLISSKLISRNVKPQMYNTLNRPTVTYAFEKWVLKENMTNKLMIFERKMTRKILVLQEQMMATGELKLVKK